jgi:hypothetical protein
LRGRRGAHRRSAQVLRARRASWYSDFHVLFGLAATRIPTEQRERLVGFFEAVAETMLVIVRWVLWVAPLGVFALSLVVGMRAGIGAAGAILHYILVVVAVCLLVIAASTRWCRWPASRLPGSRAPRRRRRR